MNLIQMEWVLEKALHIVKKYKGKEVTEEDCEEAFEYARKVYKDSKENEFCKQVMFKVLDSMGE